MPRCLECNRNFANREALHQHLRSSGAEHPVCIPCDRRFISRQARDEHIAARHPPTYPCSKCERTFNAQFALEDHYRGSTAHPNCAKCGRGFEGLRDRDEHHQNEHPQVACAPCNGILIYEDSTDQHYKTSPNHPNCNICDQGFKDSSALNNHFLDREAHPECKSCGLVFKNGEEHSAHLEEDLRHLLDTSQISAPNFPAPAQPPATTERAAPATTVPTRASSVTSQSVTLSSSPWPTSMPVNSKVEFRDLIRRTGLAVPPPSPVIRTSWATMRNVQVSQSLRTLQDDPLTPLPTILEVTGNVNPHTQFTSWDTPVGRGTSTWERYWPRIRE
ncbi:hypothetical protein D9615_005050 [Tricholomella constricta]|uniref:C2H2-type domain-containing protein n=1 Tax=Tricholomella constricta TaxID=117010 RepID=A0A8H5HH43_9AGAR|nr:hypothetical protein D9615_005050 [Tricholomella constricta]